MEILDYENEKHLFFEGATKKVKIKDRDEEGVKSFHDSTRGPVWLSALLPGNSKSPVTPVPRNLTFPSGLHGRPCIHTPMYTLGKKNKSFFKVKIQHTKFEEIFANHISDKGSVSRIC